MFFHITAGGHDSPLLERAHQYSWCDKSFKPHTLYIDKGWTFTENGDVLDWRKGYSLESKLEDVNVNEDSRGHFCVIQFHKGDCSWSVHSDNFRGFPIFYTDDEITNLPGTLADPKNVLINKYIALKDTASVHRANYSKFDFPQKMSMDEVVEKITHELTTNLTDYLKYNNNKIYVDITGGYDTTALLAIMNHNKIPYTQRARIRAERNGPDELGDELLQYMREEHWGYYQLTMVPEGMALLTGFLGDEYSMRNPGYVAHVLKARGVKLSEHLSVDGDGYMSRFIRKNYLNKIAEVETDEVRTDAEIMNALAYDWQMWHYHNQITIMPWKSQKIINYCFGLSSEDIIDQLLNTTIQKRIIENLDSALLDSISDYKNE